MADRRAIMLTIVTALIAASAALAAAGALRTARVEAAVDLQRRAVEEAHADWVAAQEQLRLAAVSRDSLAADRTQLAASLESLETEVATLRRRTKATERRISSLQRPAYTPVPAAPHYPIPPPPEPPDPDDFFCDPNPDPYAC